jgi:hypothetical protein
VVKQDGKVLWDKRRQGDEFPDDAAILQQLGK